MELLNKTYEGGAIIAGVEEVEKNIEKQEDDSSKGGNPAKANEMKGCKTDEDCKDENPKQVCVDDKCQLKEQNAGSFNIDDYLSETLNNSTL